MRIMGIDPGYKKTGFGIIDVKNKKNVYITSGCIYSSKLNILESFKNIFNDITVILKKYKPDIIAIENIFVYENRNSILKLAQTRGVIISAIAIQNLFLVEYSPKKIKKIISGYGSSDKYKVRFIVQKMLNIKKITSLDSADALSIAITHMKMIK